MRERQGEDDDDPAGRGPDEPEQLREEARAPARDEAESEEDDDPDVDEVHRPSIDEDGEARPRRPLRVSSTTTWTGVAWAPALIV